MNEKLTIIQPNTPEPMVFAASGAVKVTAYGLAAGDCIHFVEVEQVADSPRYTSGGCAIYAPTASEIALSVPYVVGDCMPTMYSQRPVIYINRQGKYLPVVVGDNSDGQLMVKVEPVADREFSAAELGIDPCGCPCVDTAWAWTGNTRCNGDFIEREYESNCGNTEWREYKEIEWQDTGVTRCENHVVQREQKSTCGDVRWTDTAEKCGYSPSIAMMMEQCGGTVQYGYAYSDGEERDPAATVSLTDCDGKVHGWIYPTEGAGHTVEVADCDGNVIGYLANQSTTAPRIEQVQRAGDVIVNVPPAEVTVNVPKQETVNSVVGLTMGVDGMTAVYHNGTTAKLDFPTC